MGCRYHATHARSNSTITAKPHASCLFPSQINFASLTFSFFMVSAVFHFWALVFGIHERTWFWYWRQMDDAFCYWRWAEYSISASLMALAIALSLGIREQNALAGIFMLHWSTMWFGFLVEYAFAFQTLLYLNHDNER